ncbi:MAG: site-specific DNA-methyltransferase [Dehalococcoidia bacterium]|nr:site-specific DNA-methyltransferase [Dehalococcoidia bacterium]
MKPLELLAVESNGHYPRVVYRQEGLALIHGDARDMRELPAESVDLIITDPPFNVSFSDYGGGVKDSLSPEEYGQWTGEWLRECVRVLRDGGQLYALMPLKWLAYWLPQVPERWHILAWCKTMAHLHREKTYLRAWEPILWVVKGERPNVLRRSYRFQDDKDWFIGTSAMAEAVAVRLKKRHPTPRPDWLYEYFMVRASEPGMVVLDPMMGSGTGAYVARKLGRRFVGYDINRDYVDLSALRVAQAPMEMEPVVEGLGFRQMELMFKWQDKNLMEGEETWKS